MSRTVHSDLTHLSIDTTAIFDSISFKSKSPLFRLENTTITEQAQQDVWEATGAYIQRQMKNGKSIMVPKLGIFTFTYPDVNLKGTTNEFTRNKEPRRPVFLINKDFIKGLGLKSGIYTESGLVPYSGLSQSGNIQKVNINLSEVAAEAGTSKDNVKTGLERVIREFILRVKNKLTVRMDIPYLGTLIIQNGIAAVKFLENVSENIRESATINIKSRGDFGNKTPSRFVLDDSLLSPKSPNEKSSKPIYIQEAASRYLKTELEIDVNTLGRASSASHGFRRPLSQSTRVKNTSFLRNALSQSTSLVSTPTKAKLDFDLYVKRIRYWMRNRKLTAEDAFSNFVFDAYGIGGNNGPKMNFVTFESMLKKVEIKLPQAQAQQVFAYFDKKGDGIIDLEEWTETLAEDQEPMKLLDSIMKKNSWNVNELLQALGIDRSQNFVDQNTLLNGINRLEPNVQLFDIFNLFANIFDGKDQIEVDELVSMIESYQSNERTSSRWMSTIQSKLRSRLKQIYQREGGSPQPLGISKEVGVLSTFEFKKALAKLQMRLSSTEVDRIIKQYELPEGMIDYKRFLEEFQSSNTSQNEANFQHVAQQLQKYLNNNKLEVQTLLRQLSSLSSSNSSPTTDKSVSDTFSMIKSSISPKISIALFSLFLQKKIVSRSSPLDINTIAQSIDIDGDGFIGKDDLEIFLQRQYLYKSPKERPSTRSASVEPLSLYPTESLKEEELQIVLRDLRRKLDRSKMTNHEFFNILDENQDGFLTIDEFCERIDQILPLSQKLKEGFFAYMDRHKIGIIDYNSLVKAMHKNTYRQDVITVEDNFDWPLEKLKQIKNYFLQNKISREDAFRMVDFDFDATISKQDIKTFLEKVLKVEDATQPRVDRLFKLMDQFKRGYIQLEDFKKIFDSLAPKSPTHRISASASGISRPKRLVDNDIADWQENAKQQIGLILSKKFSSAKESFDVISGGSQKIIYKTFKKWIDETQALHGFNLTENLLLQLFSTMDPHRKGHIAFSDWEVAFSSYNWNKQLIAEFQNIMYSNFSDTHAAYEYFLKKNPQYSAEVSLSAFKNALESLLPKRFYQHEINHIWEQLTRGEETLTFESLSAFLNSSKFNKADSRIWTVSSPRSPTSTIFNNLFKQEILIKSTSSGIGSIRGAYSDDVFEKLKLYIRSGNNNIANLCRAVDRNNSGKITCMEFRNVIKKLNLGLTSIEIDQLLDFANINIDGTIDWQSFVNRIVLKKSETSLLQRCQKKLLGIKAHIYSFMVTPKDAFTTYNTTGNGKMSFEEFNTFIHVIYKAAREEVPAFSIIKDLFEFIDIKKDGLIDVHEWTQTFTQLTLLDSKTDDNNTKAGLALISKKLVDCISDWESSKNYDDVMSVIGRNRKLIMNKFLNLEQRKVVITYEVAKNVVKELLDNAKVKVSDNRWPLLLKFAEVDGVIQVKTLMEVYRDRVQRLMNIPKTSKVIYI